LKIDCAVFEAGDAAAQATLWQRFVAERSAVNVVSANDVHEDDESNEIEKEHATNREDCSREVAVAAAGHDPDL
jgi:hypothetical protein